jgi:outer membrane assembly lipoprotein YfiO
VLEGTEIIGTTNRGGRTTPTRRRRFPAWVFTLLFASLACATGPNLSEDYGQTARENYELAVVEYNDRDWEESIAYADFVRIRFPFSRFAVESELLIARAEFELRNYVTAQDAFRQFMRLHPTHEHVRNGWVPYMIAVSAYMAAPGSMPFMPAHYQRDQALLGEAITELEYFFDHYSGTEMEPLARKLEAEVERRLLEHEIYVARFYLDRDRPEAAIMRLESAHDVYPGIGLDAEVLFLLGITYLRIEEIELARETFTELQMQHPDHHHGQQARLYLKYMQDRYGPADPNRARPDRSPPQPETPPRAKPDEIKDWRWRREQERKAKQGETTPIDGQKLEPYVPGGEEDEDEGDADKGAKSKGAKSEPKSEGKAEPKTEPKSEGKSEPKSDPEPPESDPPDSDSKSGPPPKDDLGDKQPEAEPEKPPGDPE